MLIVYYTGMYVYTHIHATKHTGTYTPIPQYALSLTTTHIYYNTYIPKRQSRYIHNIVYYTRTARKLHSYYYTNYTNTTHKYRYTYTHCTGRGGGDVTHTRCVLHTYTVVHTYAHSSAQDTGPPTQRINTISKNIRDFLLTSIGLFNSIIHF